MNLIKENATPALSSNKLLRGKNAEIYLFIDL